MAKSVPRVGSHRNGRIGSRKSGCRIPKGVIHVPASFNNTVVTVTILVYSNTLTVKEIIKESAYGKFI